MYRLISLAAALLVIGCVNVAPGATPIRVPTVPPINIPPISIPSIPPINIPSGFIPGGSGTCALVTPQEIASIFGSAPSFTDDSGGNCTFTMANASTIVISIESGSDLETSRFVLGNSAQAVTVGGLPAVSGAIVGQPTVHV